MYVSDLPNGKEKVEGAQRLAVENRDAEPGSILTVPIPSTLELESPEIGGRIPQLQPQFPSCPPFVPPPYQNRLTRMLIREVHQPQLLSH